MPHPKPDWFAWPSTEADTDTSAACTFVPLADGTIACVVDGYVECIAVPDNHDRGRRADLD